ncbi:MAG: DUF4340 domain-containing protein [Bacteroidota bacterium]
MLRNISNTQLFIVLIALIAVYSVREFFGKPNRSKAFKANIVEIDTTAVTQVQIVKPGTSFKLKKANVTWEVYENEKQLAKAEASKVNNALTELLSLKPSRVASRKEEKWTDFQVDSSGTQVQVFEGENKTLDLIIGRFGVKNMQARQFQTYVRLADEPEVYACEDFFGASFPSNANDYRNNKLSNIERDSIISLSYTYPADTSFSLVKNGNNWLIKDELADSASVANLVRDIASASSRNFNDSFNKTGKKPQYKLIVNIAGKNEPVGIEAYQESNNWYLVSTSNPESIFSDSTLVSKLFVGKSALVQ